MNQLQEHQKRFLNSGNYTWGNGKAQADATIDATRSKIGGGMGNVQGQIMSGVDTASGRTHGIGPGYFGGHPANNHESLVTPQEEGKPTLKEADDLRDSRNKDFEEFRILPKTGSPE